MELLFGNDYIQSCSIFFLFSNIDLVVAVKI